MSERPPEHPISEEPTGRSVVADQERRSLLAAITFVLGGLAAAVLGVPIVGYVLGPLIRPKEDKWVDIGAVEDFAVNDTKLVDLRNPLARPVDGATGKLAAYVRRVAAAKFQIFAVNCTHLGCPVSWFPDAGLFMCPCHGGVYYSDGAHASGPPPRGLYEYEYRIEKGRLLAKLGHLPTLQQPA